MFLNSFYDAVSIDPKPAVKESLCPLRGLPRCGGNPPHPDHCPRYRASQGHQLQTCVTKPLARSQGYTCTSRAMTRQRWWGGLFVKSLFKAIGEQ
ncbi:hypothetical protein TIFTF001_050937, partial [Ficus carica]